MELESYTSVVLRQSLREVLSPKSPLWPEVKVFLAICKTAGQRLPPEVQVWNLMNVRKGLRRLLRLSPSYGSNDTSESRLLDRTVNAGCAGKRSSEDHDPRQVELLLRWIVERAEVAAAYGLQRLRIGHQVNWISALLASLARIRQFCVEILDKLEKKTVKCTTAEPRFDEGVPLDRKAFARLRAGQSTEHQSEHSSFEAQTAKVGRNEVKCQKAIRNKGATTGTHHERHADVKRHIKVRESAERPGSGSDAEGDSGTDTGNKKLPKHPIILQLRGDIKKLMKGRPAATKASLKKIYGIALKRSRLCDAGDDRAIKKLCRMALKKAQAKCEL